ncbi:hypothetical protein E4L95_22370 [Paracoccus liaowanqingii]|uniref:Tyrosine-protein kinase G-rich domain-containing protein n=1 Tax=Paracoccus liaowanqingii TaxID=2560053 RepID=A0A4Z1CDT0_9RHOB|nr:hypothetical protein E4L95_22370 [Paracoccus liaowanqingii]
MLRSDRIATAVAAALDLGNDPRFIDQPKSILEPLRKLLPQASPAELSPEDEARLLLTDIVSTLHQNVWIARVGESYVIKIDYTSYSSDLSAEVANAYAEAYLQDQIASQIGAAQRVTEWLAAQMTELRQRAFEADLAVQSLRADTPRAIGAATANGVDGAAQRVVELRHLEREAETFRTLYEVAVGRHQESIQQQTFPITLGRIISPATPPLRPSSPRKFLVLALGLFAGLGAGVGLAASRELRDRSFRTSDRVRSDLGLLCFGNLPFATRAGPRPAPGTLFQPALLRQTLDAPLSPYTETLRATLAAVDGWPSKERRPRVIGLFSALPSEGVTSTAANLALLSAASGTRTLLVDGDLREAGLSRSIFPEAKTGLPAAVADQAVFDQSYLVDPQTGLAVLPTILNEPNVGQVLGPATMQALLERAEGRFDRIFVDLAPAGLFSDVRSVDPFLDGVLLVVRWGKTPRTLVRSLVNEDPGLRRKIVGVLLSQVELDRVYLYADRGSPDFYRATGAG